MHMVHVHIIDRSNKLHVILLKQGQYSMDAYSADTWQARCELYNGQPRLVC